MSSAAVSGNMAVPSRWRAFARPFLQRADEFDTREPVVAYFLRRHVLFTCMRDRPKNDAECSAFLSTLMTALESAAATLGTQAKEEYGKAVLPLFGLKLFALADTAERTGGAAASVRTVRQFFTAALVLEATAQFSEDGASVEADVAEKCKYAKYIAVRMKRALDAGVPYESPNAPQPPSSSSLAAGATAPPPEDDEGGAAAAGTAAGAAAASGFSHHSSRPASEVHAPRAVSPPVMPSYQPPPIVTTPPPPPPPPPPAPAATHAKPTPAATTTSPSVYRHSSNNNNGGVSIETMIDAQKYARQAVSALQFYDAANAVRQLREALRLLEDSKTTA